MTTIKSLMKLSLWFVLPLALAFLLAKSHAKEIPVGGKAPSFNLWGNDRKEHSLKNYQKKIVVLEWYNRDCPFVRKHYDSNNMQNLQKKYTKSGIIWLTIMSSAKGKQGYFTIDDVKKEIIDKEKFKGTKLLFDPTGKVGRSYGAKTTPHFFIIDKKRQVVYQGAIDNIQSIDKDDIPKAKNYVAEILDQLLASKKVKSTRTKPYGCSVKY